MISLSVFRGPRRAARVLRVLAIGLAASIALALAFCLVNVFPEPAFKYKTVHGQYQVWSDEPIPREIAAVLDDATRRLRTSPLYHPDTPVKIFICNAPWRMRIYGMHLSTRFGGAADVWLTRHAVIRASDIAANRIRSPGPGPIADAQQRPLSYFIAHETTHNDVSRAFGRTVMLRYPRWLLEGYADYVGKGGDFDFDAERARFLAGAPELDHKTSGLYRGFHLKVAYLLDKKGWTLDQVFANPPSESELDAWLTTEVGAQ